MDRAPYAGRRGRRSAVAATLLALAALVLAPWPAAADGKNDLGKLGGKLLRGVMDNAERIWAERDRLLGRVSAEEEAELGRVAGAVLLGAAPPVRDEAVQRYVARVGAWLALHTERPGLRWRFAVIDDPTVNAFATPGGGVLVTRGLFLVLGDEAELAGVLAHEMAHVVARHHVRAMVSEARLALLSDLVREAVDHRGPLPEALIGASREVYASGLDRGDELEADRMGSVIAARAGYDPFGLYRVLQTLEAAGGDPELLGLFLATHPPPAERLDTLDERLPPAFDRLGGPAPAGELAALQARLR